MKSKKEIYFKNSILGFFGNVIANGSGYIYLYVLNRYLNPEEYGNYILAFTIISMVNLLINGGFTKLLLYKTSKIDNSVERDRFSGSVLFWVILFSIIISFFLYISSPFFVNYFENEKVIFWIKGLLFIIPLMNIRIIYTTWLSSNQKISEDILSSQYLFPLFKLILVTILLYFNNNIYSIVIGLALSEFLSIVYWAFKYPFWKKINYYSLTKKDWKYNFHVLFGRLIYKYIDYMDILMIGLYISSKAVAEYKIAWKVAALIYFGDKILTKIIVPRLSLLLSNNKKDDLLEEYFSVRNLSLLFSLITGLVLVILGEELILFIGEYKLGYSILLILICKSILDISFTNIGNLLQMSGESKIVFYDNILLFIMNLLGNYILIKWVGVIGVSVSTFLSIIVIDFIVYIQARIRLDINLINSKILIISILPVMSVLLYLFKFINIYFVIFLFFFSIIYLLTDLKDLFKYYFNKIFI